MDVALQLPREVIGHQAAGGISGGLRSVRLTVLLARELDNGNSAMPDAGAKLALIVDRQILAAHVLVVGQGSRYV
jgi:hypothetical protein